MEWPKYAENFWLGPTLRGRIFACFGRHGFTNAQAISVVSQIKDGGNLVSLILAKTLLGLDSVFNGGES